MNARKSSKILIFPSYSKYLSTVLTAKVSSLFQATWHWKFPPQQSYTKLMLIPKPIEVTRAHLHFISETTGEIELEKENKEMPKITCKYSSRLSRVTCISLPPFLSSMLLWPGSVKSRSRSSILHPSRVRLSKANWRLSSVCNNKIKVFQILLMYFYQIKTKHLVPLTFLISDLAPSIMLTG